MRTETRSIAAPALIITLMLLGMALFVYVGGYFLLAELQQRELVILIDGPVAPDERRREVVALDRIYSNAWLADIYRPMAALEGWWRGISVHLWSVDRVGDDFEFEIEVDEPVLNVEP